MCLTLNSLGKGWDKHEISSSQIYHEDCKNALQSESAIVLQAVGGFKTGCAFFVVTMARTSGTKL